MTPWGGGLVVGSHASDRLTCRGWHHRRRNLCPHPFDFWVLGFGHEQGPELAYPRVHVHRWGPEGFRMADVLQGCVKPRAGLLWQGIESFLQDFLVASAGLRAECHHSKKRGEAYLYTSPLQSKQQCAKGANRAGPEIPHLRARAIPPRIIAPRRKFACMHTGSRLLIFIIPAGKQGSAKCQHPQIAPVVSGSPSGSSRDYPHRCSNSSFFRAER